MLGLARKIWIVFYKPGKTGIDKKGLRFSKQGSIHGRSNNVFVRATEKEDKNQCDAVSLEVNVSKQKVFKKNTKR